MRRSLRIWGIFLLALLPQCLGAARLEPIIAPLELPSALAGKPIWLLDRLSDGRLVAGGEGALAIGGAGGEWIVARSPDGQVVRAVSEAHSRIIVAGHGFIGFLEGSSIRPVQGRAGRFDSICAVEQGWLVSGSGGVVLVSAEGQVSNVIYQEGSFYRVERMGSKVVISGPDFVPMVWADGRLQSDPELAKLGRRFLYWPTRDYVYTDKGLRLHSGESPYSEEMNRAFVEPGVVGLAQMNDLLVVGTLWAGVKLVHPKERRELLSLELPGRVSEVFQAGESILVGTTEGAFAMANPALHQGVSFKDEFLSGFLASEDGRLHLVGTGRTAQIGVDGAMGPFVENDIWPSGRDVQFSGKTVQFRGHIVDLPTRLLYGVAVERDTLAIAIERGLHMADASGRSWTASIKESVTGVVGIGGSFLVSTNMDGIHVIDLLGRTEAKFGSGRSRVREVADGRVVVLMWDGRVLDGAFREIGRIDFGHPIDAAHWNGELHVLVRRADRESVVVALRNGVWTPLEIPGLVGEQPEFIVVSGDHLYVASTGKVLRSRLPLAASPLPSPRYFWSAPVDQHGVVRVPSEGTGEVSLQVVRDQLPPYTIGHLELTLGGHSEPMGSTGRITKFAVESGTTDVTIKLERNGLVAEQRVQIVRAYPWYLRMWMWPVYLLILGCVVVGSVRWRTRVLQRRNEDLETRVNERTEALKRASAIKEEFLASISHEIRNPLNGVVGICAMLGDLQVGAKEKHLARTLAGCADQLRSMLDDILDFSRLERGAITLSPTDFDAVSLVEEAARAMDPDLSSCVLMVPEGERWLHGDSGKIRQILCNLISNALKYGVPREAGIELRAETLESGRSRLRIAVRNSGATIPDDVMEQLFDSFKRGENTRNIPGSGIGLAVSRRLARAMGGTLTGASRGGVTEFAFEVVLANGAPRVATPCLPKPVSRALAIEDEDYNRVALGHVLAQLGYAVDWAENGAAALKLASRNSYDLVLTDWRLPDTNGADLCRELRKIMPVPLPPVVAVTAYSTGEKIEDARKAGMAGFVTKPVTREKLERVVRALSEGMNPRRSLDAHIVARSSTQDIDGLGDLAPSRARLLEEISAGWKRVSTLASLQDPRTGTEAHKVLGLLRFTGEEAALEQMQLLEQAADAGDWATVRKLLEFAAEEILGACDRLRN